jgi:D-serine deaminase-like pyridoxal phosphate-dependent protein
MPSLLDLPTPALLLDLDVLDRNIAAMAARIAGLGARLRPHVKTHKCIEVAERQRAAGAQGITVATIVEARDFAEHGFDDITWAFPLPVSRLDEVVALARRITFRVTVESIEATDALEAAARRAGLRLHTFLEVDCGHHRSGVDPDRHASLALAKRLAYSPHLHFDGVLTHGGHAYHARTREERQAIARQEVDRVVSFAHCLRADGIAVETVSVGSTPTMTVAEDLGGANEARPGNYVFFDWMQAIAGVCTTADIAVTVLATVVSHQPGAGHCIVDAGALAMSKDTGPGPAELRRGLGPLRRGLTGTDVDPVLTLTAVSQEHGHVSGGASADLGDRLPVGERVRIIPNHSCLTAAMFDAYHVVRGDQVLDRWPILRGR